MKWFKHMVDAHKDPTLRAIFKKYGLEGEARFWRLVSIIAEKYENGTEHIILDLETIRESLRFRSATDCRPFLDLLSTQTQMIFDYSGNIVRIKWDKLLEIKDNHTRNLQATGNKVSKNLHLDKDIDIDKDKDKDIYNTPLPPKGDDSLKFEDVVAVWNASCYKYGLSKIEGISEKRKRLFKAASKNIQDIEDWKSILTAAVDRSFVKPDGKAWKPTIDYVLRSGKALELLEEFNNSYSGINLDEI